MVLQIVLVLDSESELTCMKVRVQGDTPISQASVMSLHRHIAIEVLIFELHFTM